MMKSWTPTDGDAFLTRDNLVFYTFGYEHPPGRILAFLKYIPSHHSSLFPIEYLPTRWKLGSTELARPRELYSVNNLQKITEALRRSFPDYLYHCPYRNKEVTCPTRGVAKRVYVPSQRLRALLKEKNRNHLQNLTSELVNLLSSTSGVPLEDLGVHGSIALGMETDQSDIDLVAYGAQNFRKLEAAVNTLAEEGALNYVFNNKLDAARKQRGRFKGKAFVYTAVRKKEEIYTKYGDRKYSATAPVRFRCTVVDDQEAMFRPATYKINNYQPLDPTSQLESNRTPSAVVSMIGMHRNVARKGDCIEVSGVLERVEHLQTGRISFQAVVGSGTSEEEYIWPVSSSETETQ